jgi:hypothetical protein
MTGFGELEAIYDIAGYPFDISGVAVAAVVEAPATRVETPVKIEAHTPGATEMCDAYRAAGFGDLLVESSVNLLAA